MIIYSANKDNFSLFLKIIPVIQSLSPVHSLQPHGLFTPGFPVLHCLPEFAQIHVHWIGDAIEQSHPLLPSSPLAFHLSQNQGLFQGVCYLLLWPKYWSFSFSISSSNEYSWLISFRIDWLDLLAAQGTLKGLLQCHSLEALILWCSAFFNV